MGMMADDMMMDMADDTAELPPELQDLLDELRAAKQAKIENLGKIVAKKREEAVKGRRVSGIEAIWEEDEEYYMGIDDANRDSHPWLKSASTTGGISRTPPKRATRCTAFFNITRQFVDAGTARMGDILLPAGDWNWTAKPSPVQDDAYQQPGAEVPPMGFPASSPPVGANTQPGMMPQMPQGQTAPLQEIAVPGPNVASGVQAEAEKKAELAQNQMRDWLVECAYHAEVRKVIEDAAKVGTGILKGPYPHKRTTRVAKRTADGVALELKTTITPASRRVDPWDFFPDPACGDNIHDGSYLLERERMTAKQLKDLKGLPGYISANIDQVLEEGPGKKHTEGDRSNQDNTADVDKFEVWYFYGQVDLVHLDAMSVKLDDKDASKDTLPAVVTIVNDTPIKAHLNPLDTGEFPYDVMPWQPMSGTWTGIGIARQGRTAQDTLNAAARNMMDNAGLAGGPMIVMRRGAVVPADGQWEVTARKVWYATEQADTRSVADAFITIDIPMMVNELNLIIQFAYKQMEDATGIFFIMQGQQGSAPDTVGGMQLLHNNASTILRRLARVFDERVTEPHINRLYEWLLLYGPDECKGDVKIEAIGSTALVERDIQNMESMVLLQLSANPAYGIDPEKAITEVLKAKRYIPDKWLMDDDKKKQQANQQPIIPAIEVAKIRAQSDQAIAQMQQQASVQKVQLDTDRDREYVQAQEHRDQTMAAARMEELRIKRELALLDFANKRNLSLDKIKADLSRDAMKLRVQRELAQTANVLKAPQVATPPTEPPQHAPDGQAFQQ